MLKILNVTIGSLKMAMEELWNNKLRTLLSLLGITIGIFCIIGVLAVVNSLKQEIESGMKEMGQATVFVQKWPWGGGGGEYPWWKYMKRPEPKYEELSPIIEQSHYAKAAAFMLFNNSNVEYKDNVLTGVTWYGATDDFHEIQEVKIEFGRYISPSEFSSGSQVLVMGHENAVKLFDEPERAIGKQVNIAGRTCTIIGVTRKAGRSMIGGWDFDNIIILPFNFVRQVVDERRADRFLLVAGKDGVNVSSFKDELKGIMRKIRKLKPNEEDNFSLNDVTSTAAQLDQLFSTLNLAGFAIGGFSLIVGLFGIANIMFVTVKERTSQIGLKKAVGAQPSHIMLEFLMESAFLCIIGGIVGLLLVFGITTAFTVADVLPFAVTVAPSIILLAMGISVVVGVLAGLIPAIQAARLDPVVAIRS